MRNEKQIESASLAWVYGGLGIICMVWDWISNGSPFYAWSTSKTPSLLFIFLAIGFVALYVVSSVLVSRTFAWARELEGIFKQLLTPISYLQVALLALVSGFVEEWFFRGILLNHFGLFISAILFGLAHLLPFDRLWIWSAWTMAAGLLLGLIYQASGSLLLVSLIHASINGLLILFINLKFYDKASEFS